MSEPVEIPEYVVERIGALCLALPEVTVRVDDSRTSTRSTAYSFDIRRRSFCLLVATADAAGKLEIRTVVMPPGAATWFLVTQ